MHNMLQNCVAIPQAQFTDRYCTMTSKWLTFHFWLWVLCWDVCRIVCTLCTRTVSQYRGHSSVTGIVRWHLNDWPFIFYYEFHVEMSVVSYAHYAPELCLNTAAQFSDRYCTMSYQWPTFYFWLWVSWTQCSGVQYILLQRNLFVFVPSKWIAQI